MIVPPGPIAATWFHPSIIYGPTDPAPLIFGEGAGLAADDVVGNFTSFGGLASGGLSNISLVYGNWSASAWNYANTSVAPTARANVTFATYQADDVAVLFGGITNLTSQVCSNETWLYWFRNQTFENVTAGPAPPPRESAAFAVDQSRGLGVLQGGWDPAYSQGGSNASVIWNDSWAFNFTTHTWSRLALASAPVPRFGESMVWDPLNRTFYLFGGCSTYCSSDVWTWRFGGVGWTRINTIGAPSPRGASSVVWDPYDQTILLFGGFNWGSNGPIALGETYQFDAPSRTWYDLLGAGDIPAAYDSPAVFADYPGCIGMWVQGGSGALAGIVYNISFLVPAGVHYPDCTNRPGSGPGPPPPPPCKGNATLVSVRTVDAVTGRPIADASVNVTGYCSTEAGPTDGNGYFNVTMSAPDNLSVTATYFRYRSFSGLSDLSSGIPDLVVVRLVPLPVVCVRVDAARLAGSVSPLPNATVTLDASTVVGETDPLGWANATVPFGTGSTAVVSASVAGFSSSSRTVSVPWTGRFVVNLTVLAAGSFDVEVLAGATQRPVPGAYGTIASVGPGGLPPLNYHSDGAGWANLTLPLGNYSVSALGAGYGPNATAVPVFHPWLNSTQVVLRLGIEYGSNLTVSVRDQRSGQPVAGAMVVLGGTRMSLTNGDGATSFIDVLPAGRYLVAANASGYLANSTLVDLPYLGSLHVGLSLRPAPSCAESRTCPTASTNRTGAGGSLWLPGGGTFQVLLLAPAVLYAGAVVYLIARDRGGGWGVAGARGAETRFTPRPRTYSEHSGRGSPP